MIDDSYAILNDEPPKYYIPRRYFMIVLGFYAIMVCYILRVVVSVTVLPMQEEYGWSDSYKGLMLSAFFMGYLLTQIPTHFMCERWGGKRVLLVGLTLSNVASILLPAAVSSKVGLMALRIVVGIAQGVTFPTMNFMIKNWFPESRRSTSAAAIWSGIYVGTIIIDTCAPKIMNTINWQTNYYIFGGIGLLWSVLWALFIKDDPKDAWGVHPSEVNEILNDKEEKRSLITNAVDGASSPSKVGINQYDSERHGEGLPYMQVVRALFSSAGIYALIWYNLMVSFVFYFLLMWLPTWMKQMLDGNTGGLFSFLIVLPYILSFFMATICGYLSDKLIERGIKKIYVRKTLGLLSAVLPGICMFLINYAHLSNNIQIGLMVITVASVGFSSPGPNMITFDLAPKQASVVMGIGNAVSTVVGILGNLIGGILLEKFHGSWVPIFSMCGAFYFSAGIGFALFGKSDPVI